MEHKKQKSFAGTALLMGVIILAAKVLGLVRDMLIARHYGTTMEAVAYETASRLPVTVFDLVIGGVVTTAFIPVYNSLLVKEGEKAALHWCCLSSDLSVLASQVSSVLKPVTLIYSIGLGVGIFLVLSVIKIIFKRDLSMMLMFFYMLMFAISCIVIVNGNASFLALSFDSGGVTTGPITVPFIMALGVGIASTIGGRESKENSFGLIALCSIGPILTVLLLGMGIDSSKLNINPSANDYFIPFTFSENLNVLIQNLIEKGKEVIIALSLIVVSFLIIQFIFIKLPRKKLTQIFIGIAYTFVGLVLFLTAASIG